jgi:hypothetical protein
MMKRLVSCLIAVLVVSGTALAQQPQQTNPPTLVQQSPSDLRACTPAHSDAAVNNTVTITITPPNGLYVYLCGWDYQVVQDATGTVQTNVKWTSTNLGGLAVEYSTPLVVDGNTTQNFYYAVPLKAAQAGVAVTIVSPAAVLHTAYSANAYYYIAP